MSSNRIQNLRKKIQARTAELGITPQHDERGHWYRYKDQVYPSVTKKLSLIKDEALMSWKMNRALEYVEKALFNAKQPPLEQILEQAKLAPVKEFEGAGDIGSTVHKWREIWFKQWLEMNESSLMVEPPLRRLAEEKRSEVIASCNAIINCLQTLHAQPLACELRLADDKLKLGGSLDDIWAVPIDEKIKQPHVDGDPLSGGFKFKRRWEIWLVDLKTSNIGNKNSYYMQVATYWAMFRKLYGIKIDKLFILHTSKKRFGEYDLIPIKHPERYYEMAQNVYKLYDDLKELEELKKPEIAKI